jgi:hypothetical protein
MSDLLYDQLLVTLSLLALPENPLRVALHILNVIAGVFVLLVAKSNGEAGSYFLTFHRFSNCLLTGNREKQFFIEILAAKEKRFKKLNS